MSDVQDVVDALAAAIHRPVTLEEPSYRLIAHSGPPTPMDQVRLASVLGRRAEPWVVAHFERFGIAEASGRVEVPADGEHGLLPRWCVPVRHRSALLAYLWVLLGDAPAHDPDEIALVERAAVDLGLLLDGERFSRRVATQLLRQLLSSAGAPDADEIERELHTDGAWAHRGPAVVLVAAASSAGAGPSAGAGVDRVDLDIGDALGEALVEIVHALPSATALHLSRADEAVLVVAVRDATTSAPVVAALAEQFAQRTARHLGAPAIVAVGEVVDRLAAARDSLRTAHLALRVGLALPGLGPVVTWSALGVFRALALVPQGDIVPLALDERVRALLANGDDTLAATAETYLDRAGDAQATAAALHVHRATLYHRLDRLRETTGLDLRQGDDRLVLHLGLKLARLRR